MVKVKKDNEVINIPDNFLKDFLDVGYEVYCEVHEVEKNDNIIERRRSTTCKKSANKHN